MGETPKHVALRGAGNITLKSTCEIHTEDYMLIQNTVGSAGIHELEIGVLDKAMIIFLETLASFTVSSVVTIEENTVLDDILTKPGWDIDFTKGVEIGDLKRYMEKLEFQEKINYTNYRVIALYTLILMVISLYIGWMIHCYLNTLECTFRRTRKQIRVPTNSLEEMRDNSEGHYELELRN